MNALVNQAVHAPGSAILKSCCHNTSTDATVASKRLPISDHFR
jgi:hypothetical protein